MSDQNNDTDIDNNVDDFDDGGFEEFGKKGTIADLWRNNPFVKIGIILAAFIFVVAGIILFGGRPDPSAPSRVASTTDVNEAPGSNEISPAYQQAIEETNQVRTEQAIRDDSSVVPMPVAPAPGVLPQQLEQDEEEDPLDRWRRMQEERAAQEQLVTPEPQDIPPEVDTRTPAVAALSQAMAQQMESVLAAQQIKGPTTKNIASISYLEGLEAKRLQQLQAGLQAQQIASAGTLQDIGKIIVPAGTIEYAQLITEANTDAPGPVLAQIQSGPLKGARVLGSFRSTEEFLTLNFNMVIVDGVNQQTSAVALDPGTTLPGLVTDIDRRYFKRIILPAAASFIEGLAEAVANSDTTTVTIIGDSASQTTSTGSGSDRSVASGIESAGETISDIFDDEADRTKPMLKIRAGTPIGVLFLTPVLEKPLPIQTGSANPYGYSQPGFFGGGNQQQPFFGQGNPYAQGYGQPYYDPYAANPSVVPTNTTPTTNNTSNTSDNDAPNFFGNGGYLSTLTQENDE